MARDVKAKAKKKFFGSEVVYDNPKGMDEFLMFFMEAWRNAVAANDSAYETKNQS